MSEQTNRTILFEKFTEDDGKNIENIAQGNNPNQVVKEINEELLVKSYGEFLEKFPPVYYMDIIDDGGMPRFEYYTTPHKRMDGSDMQQFFLCDQPFYKALMKCYESKGRSGKNDYELDFSDLEKVLDPQYSYDEAMSLRGRMSYTFNKILKLQEKGASQYEISENVQELMKLRKTAAAKYKSDDIMAVLPIAMKDTEEKIKMLGTAVNSSASNNTLALSCSLELDDKGMLVTKALNNLQDLGNEDAKRIGTSNPNNPSLRALICSDYESINTDSSGQNSFVKNMIVDTYSGGETSIQIPPEKIAARKQELENNLNSYYHAYTKSQQSFAQALNSMMEKLIGVKAFFDHAEGKAELIIANRTAEDIYNISDHETQEKVFEYLSSTGREKRISDKTWFAIIPSIEISDFADPEPFSVGNMNGDDLFGQMSIGNIVDSNNYSSVPAYVDLMLEKLAESTIITFLSVKGSKKTNFDSLNKELVCEYKKLFEPISNKPYSDQAVFCYPNFTVLPERVTNIKIPHISNGVKIEESIQVKAVYIDAAYIAAGLTAATQNVDLLNEKGFTCHSTLGQPVRFNFESSFVNKYDKSSKIALSQLFPTKFNRSSILSWNDKLIDEIRKEGGFGFCFCGDEITYMYKNERHVQSNSYVYCSRTLKKDTSRVDGARRYRPMYKSLVCNYLNSKLKGMSADVVREEIEKYNTDTSRNYINGIVYTPSTSGVKQNEEISIEDNKVSIVYDSDTDILPIEIEEI